MLRYRSLLRPLPTNRSCAAARVPGLAQSRRRPEAFVCDGVDPAVRALVQQQATLARIERRLAVAEVSAQLAHALRNPLAGVLMTLVNLRAEIDATDPHERLVLAIAELERIGHLLSSLVDTCGPAAERARPLRLHSLVDDLLHLLRCLIADHIALANAVAGDLCCRLPEDGLRLALMSLAMNAAQALRERPGAVRIGAARHAGALRIWVSDDGPGFPGGLLEGGVPALGDWHPGDRGLSLVMVQRFAAANAGRLRLDNRPGGGACASLVFTNREAV
jgi:signal transduction histidine kinase